MSEICTCFFLLPLLSVSYGSVSSMYLYQKNLHKFNIQAAYNLIYNASLLVEQGVGSALAISGLVSTSEHDPLAFIPLDPQVRMQTSFVWKKNHLLSRAAEVFLDELKEVFTLPFPCP